jgi:hypothetical protein
LLWSTIMCSDGATGPKWDTWPQGTTWATWAQWIQWAQWVIGNMWPQGNTWATWAQWIQWVIGNTWPKWDTWATGPKWDTWPQGNTWATWAQWIQWVIGNTWPQGNTWATWATWVGIPAGNVWEVQFNDGSVFGSTKKFFRDNILIRLWIGLVNSPEYTLDIGGAIKWLDYISSQNNTWKTTNIPFLYSGTLYCMHMENGLFVGLWTGAIDISEGPSTPKLICTKFTWDIIGSKL